MRNKADAGLVMYRAYNEGNAIVLSRKIRRRPVCSEPGGVKFGFIGAKRIRPGAIVRHRLRLGMRAVKRQIRVSVIALA